LKKITSILNWLKLYVETKVNHHKNLMLWFIHLILIFSLIGKNLKLHS